MPAHAETPAAAVKAATTLALWAAAAATGASPDTVLDALREVAGVSGVRAHSTEAASRTGLPAPGEHAASLAALLPLLRGGGPPRLVVPVPGDLRGLAAGSEAAVCALEAGAAVALPDREIALVPRHGEWRVCCGGRGHDEWSERETRLALDDALSEAVKHLHRLDIASDRGDPRRAVARAIAEATVTPPPGTPSEATRLLQTAITVEATLSVARDHETAAVTAGQSAAVDAALAPLAAVAREARRTAVAMAVAALRPAARETVPAAVSRPPAR